MDNRYINEQNMGAVRDMNQRIKNNKQPYTNRRYESIANNIWQGVKAFTPVGWFTDIETDRLDRDYSFKLSDYYRSIDDNKYQMRELTNNLIDMQAPMQLYDKRIAPTIKYSFINKNDKHDGWRGLNPMYGDITSFYGYDPLLIKPVSMRTKQDWENINKKYPKLATQDTQQVNYQFTKTLTEKPKNDNKSVVKKVESIPNVESVKTSLPDTITIPQYSKMVDGKRVTISKEEYDKITKGKEGTPTGYSVKKQDGKVIQVKQTGGKIKTDPQGYWNKDNHGKPVRINSNKITMQGVNQPLLGISDTGDMKMMSPGMEYSFDGNSVTEFPITMQQGGQVRQPIRGTREQYQAYQDSLFNHNFWERNHQRVYDSFKNELNATNNDWNPLTSDLTENRLRVNLDPNNPPSWATGKGNQKPYEITTWDMPGNVRKNPEIPRGQVPGFFSARFTKPVQPIIYQPQDEDFQKVIQDGNNRAGIHFKLETRQKQNIENIQPRQLEQLQIQPINQELQKVPFSDYFSRERQNQELDSKQFGRKRKKDYFDKKTGKLLGTYKNGGKISDCEIIFD